MEWDAGGRTCRGLYDEGEATLRLRMDPGNVNRNMDDVVAYRIKYVAHPHVGGDWCIYPSYDFTHCIVDSLEQVTHSLCTLEFDSRRASYYWLLDALGLYMPCVWEYSRLNLTNNVMSKRKIQARGLHFFGCVNRPVFVFKVGESVLCCGPHSRRCCAYVQTEGRRGHWCGVQLLVTDGYIRGWDDPRLPTLAGMRRRGMSPEGINSLCQELGITRSEIHIPLHKVYHHIRGHLEESSPRALGVLRPLKLVRPLATRSSLCTHAGFCALRCAQGTGWVRKIVCSAFCKRVPSVRGRGRVRRRLQVITNLAEDHVEHVRAAEFPGRGDASYEVPFSRVCYIEQSDFQTADSKDYYGLAPGKTVMLRCACVGALTHGVLLCGAREGAVANLQSRLF